MNHLHTIHTNGVHLHYVEAPGPGPALVIIHGLTGSHDEFMHLVPELRRRAHVYLLDLRGHGRSEHAGDGYQIADYGGDVITFLREVVGRPAVVLGHSLGGIVTAWVAARAPELFQSVIFEDAPFYILQMPRFGETWFYDYFTALRDYLGDYQARGGRLEELLAHVGQTPVEEGLTWLDVAGPEAVRQRAVQLHQLDPATLDPALAGTLLGSHEPDDLLARIHRPVHLLAAPEGSGALSARDVERVVAQIPHCTHAIVENAGHDIHLDQPRAFLDELTHILTAAARTTPR